MPSPIITPAGPLSRAGKDVQDFTANQAVTWSASGGTLSLITATTARWTAPNVTGAYTVTATNGVDPSTVVTITVMAVLPNYWSWKNPVIMKKDVLIFKPISGPKQTRTLSPSAHNWELGNEDTSYERFLEMEAFWDAHHPGKKFAMIDPVKNERRTYQTDSDYNGHYNSADSFSWSGRIEEAWPYVVG